MPTSAAVDIATKVLIKARMIDYRMRLGSTDEENAAQIAAWAEVFDGEPVWPREALDAVAAHYKKSNAFQIMPGDVLEFCKRQPVTSSPEHVSWFLDRWAQHPWSTAIEELVGKPIPGLEPDSNDVRDKPRLIEQRRAFIDKHRGYFIEQIMANTDRKAIEQ